MSFASKHNKTARYKALLNSIYGLFVQNPVKFNFRYRTTGWLPYQIGVLVTSYARLRLEKGLNAIPPQAFIYADTDSIKFQGDEYVQIFVRHCTMKDKGGLNNVIRK